MTEWIKQQAEQIKKRERDEKDDRTWQLYVEEKINSGWQEAWSQIRLEIEAQVSAFNGEFPADGSKQIQLNGTGDNALTVKREHGHRYTIIEISADSDGITLRVNSGDHSTNHRNPVKTERLNWNANKHGRVGMASAQSINLDGIELPHEAAEAILRRLF